MAESDIKDADQPASDADIIVEAPGLETLVVDAIEAGEVERVRDIVAELHYADFADLLERMGRDDRDQLIMIVRDFFDPEVLSELDERVREHVLEVLGVRRAANAISELDSDDALLVLQEMDEERQKELLDHISDTERTFIEEGLSYPEDSAGRLMQREVVTVPSQWNVGQCIDYIRRRADDGENELPSIFYDIFVIDTRHHPVGAVSLSALLRSRRQTPISEVMEEEMHEIQVTTDQEDIAFLFRQRDLVSAPVIDADGRLVGAITIDDVVDVIHEEHEEDIMRMGGVIEDDLYQASISTARARFSWLVVNLLTAIMASMVIGLFDATIQEVVALAVLMPIVASMGGNAGTQTLTVTVRALATKELTGTNAFRVISKEVIVGVFNGIAFAILSGLVAWLWFGSATLGFVIASAMVINMIIAGLAGTTIPIMLERAGVDPAIASSVFLTTITDVVGFFAFLGLAALFLL
ncbi:MAG: magnesium transporter [Rhodospirillales bacterium]